MGSRIDFIHQHHTALSVAISLGLPVSKPGDRCTSIAPGHHSQSNAFILYEADRWYDFTLDKGGDAIDLLAWAKYNGNYDPAYAELLQGYDGDDAQYSKTYRQEQEALEQKITQWHKSLRNEDFHYLHKRGITDQTIGRLRLGYDPKEQRLIIPYFKNKKVVYYASRDRSVDGYIDPKTGKAPAKYKKAYIPDHAYLRNIPWGQDSLFRKDYKIIHTYDDNGNITSSLNLKDFICIGEGFFDLMCFDQEGYKVLASGCGNFGKDNMHDVISMCKTVKFVVLCYDSDKAGQQFTKKFALEHLIPNRIKFTVIRLPEGVKDVSDYFAAGGDLDALVFGAEDGLKWIAQRLDDETEFKDFMMRSARFTDKADLTKLMKLTKAAELLDKDYVQAVFKQALKGPSETELALEVINTYNVIWQDNDGFYQYEHGVWNKISDTVVKGYIIDVIGETSHYSKVCSVLGMLRSKAVRNIRFNQQLVFNFRNGTFDFKQNQLLPHDKSFYSTIQVPYEFDRTAACPEWRNFIDTVMSHDPKKIRKIKQMCGYIFMPDQRYQCAFILLSHGSSGKTTFTTVLRKVFGEEQCTSIEIDKLAEPFYPIHLKNSILNICDEANVSFKKSEAMFKKITGGSEPIYDSYKGKDGIQFTTRAKFIISGNNYMASNDISYGFARRLEFIKFNECFRGDNIDRNLTEKLLQELPGIFNWCLEGYYDLIQNNGFVETDEQAEILHDFMRTINPVAAFVDEKFNNEEFMQENPNGVEKDLPETYSTYCVWSQTNGHARLNREKFASAMRKILYQVMPFVKIIKRNNLDSYVFPAKMYDLIE